MTKTNRVVDKHGRVRVVPDDYVVEDGERYFHPGMIFMDAQGRYTRDATILDEDTTTTTNIFDDDPSRHAAQETARQEHKDWLAEAWRHPGAVQPIKSSGGTLADAEQDYEHWLTNAWRRP